VNLSKNLKGKFNMQCLLIETKDNRQFLTHEKNFIQLIEFSKHFKANISLVKIDNGEILDLEQLAPAICNSNYKKNKIDYKVIETKMKCSKRKIITSNSTKVQKEIKNKFLQREIVSLKEIKKIFKKLNLTDATLCNHMKKVREDLCKEGYSFVKLGAGKYRIS
jgi:hypothetical protein